MITFNPTDLHGVQEQLDSALETAERGCVVFPVTGSFTGSPSVNAAFAQHQAMLHGQPGSLHAVAVQLARDIDWLATTFRVHARALVEQDQANHAFLDNLYSSTNSIMRIATMGAIPLRDTTPTVDLVYTAPPGVAEAGMPLDSLIAMFSTDDAAPQLIAEQWKATGNQLEHALAQLHHATTTLGALTTGEVFDAACAAMEDIATMGHVVVANTRVMETTVRAFSGLRASNLAALVSIEATTAAITDPAARVAAQQAAVAQWATATLQPSLQSVAPVVTNLATPVVGHAGGHHVQVGGDAAGHGGVEVDRVGRLADSTHTASVGGGLGEQAAVVAEQAGRPAGPVTHTTGYTPENPVSAPAAQAPVVAGQAPVAPAGPSAAVSAGPSTGPSVAPAGLTPTGAGAGAGAGVPGVDGVTGRGGGVYGGQPGAGSPGVGGVPGRGGAGSPGADVPGVGGVPGRGGAGSPGVGGRGSAGGVGAGRGVSWGPGTVMGPHGPQATGKGHVKLPVMAPPNTAPYTGGGSGNLYGAAPGAGGRGGVGTAPYTGGGSGNLHGAAPGTGGRGGVGSGSHTGGAHGSAGGHGMASGAHGIAGGRGAGQAKHAGGSSPRAAGKATQVVRDYFYRQFMAGYTKPKTVKKIIRG